GRRRRPGRDPAGAAVRRCRSPPFNLNRNHRRPDMALILPTNTEKTTGSLADLEKRYAAAKGPRPEERPLPPPNPAHDQLMRKAQALVEKVAKSARGIADDRAGFREGVHRSGQPRARANGAAPGVREAHAVRG